MLETRRYQIKGVVQGVGFRPFVYRAAEQYSLRGWIRNGSEGVEIEIQGDLDGLESFIVEVRTDAPALARVESVALIEQRQDEVVYEEFTIEISERSSSAATLISPDTFVCEDCLRELFDPADRRHRYPFINCTNCGPRYSIIRGVPYDRPFTTMATFPLCEACAHEYHDVTDRRFHAQPVACWDCGPQVALWEPGAGDLAATDPIAQAAGLLKAGAILACKGIGGYHLMVDPRNEEAVTELRRRKRRDEKPFALMSPTLEAVTGYASVDSCEAELLQSVARPIVLVRKRGDELAAGVAPGNQRFGVMLAYTPLHHLLLSFGFDALVATSGNVSDEPIAFTNEDAVERLSGIADVFLVNNRDIHTRVDDSIVRSVPLAGRPEPVLIRRARGYTPEPIAAPFDLPPVLGVGPELKNTVCLSRGRELFLSHHIGDLKNDAVMRSFEHSIAHLKKTLEVQPELIAHDMHPSYMSTRYALEQGILPTLAVQHHHAHMASCMCEHGLTDPAIGVIFDGTGYGTDGAIWGGEFLVGDYSGFQRAGQLEYFRLPGGDKAVKQPWRVALALLAQAFEGLGGLEQVPVVARRTDEERQVLGVMIERGIHSPATSSMGRLFDGVSALIGVREEIRYEAQAAIELEQLLERGASAQPLPWELRLEDGRIAVDPRPMIRELAEEVARGRATAAELSLRFHSTLVEMVRSSCLAIRDLTGLSTVVLSGGVFLNEFLLSGAYDALFGAGFDVYAHRRVPTNDGGVSLGQAAIAGWRAR
jgi:hydrogenase maturation protein HypF